jgi:hypothetical protein
MFALILALAFFFVLIIYLHFVVNDSGHEFVLVGVTTGEGQ